jgi:UDP-2,4-diacetamido-2,4,6-trideoxy-beta-L-altropyranose hydrolase
MKVAFRADASLQMGSGHVMRCLTLANALREKGAECHFLFREHPGHMLAQIRAAGHHIHLLALVEDSAAVQAKQGALAHADWLGASQLEDAQQSMDVLQGLQPDWLVVDHYALDICWHRVLRPLCGRLMVIDDLADRSHDCDLLLDQTFGRNAADYQVLVPENCKVLCGSRFALLRPEFAALRFDSLARRAKLATVKHILITMGGVDQANATAAVLDALGVANVAELQITVVMGAKAPWLRAVRQQALQLPLAVDVLVDRHDMADLMAMADLAIGAAGSTAWERCCLGLPSIMVILADNQRTVAAGLQAAGAAQVIASVEDIPALLPSLLAPLLSQPQRVKEMSVAANRITDGAGVQAVIQALGV